MWHLDTLLDTKRNSRHHCHSPSLLPVQYEMRTVSPHRASLWYNCYSVQLVQVRNPEERGVKETIQESF